MNDANVSVIIPCYKMGRFVGAALESVGSQTYSDWEIIVVDDAGPEDGTRQTVADFGRRYANHRVEFIRHETNRGVGAARNTAIRASKGRLLAFLDPDDIWFPSHLEIHIRIRSSPEQIGLVSASMVEMFSEKPGDRPSANWGYTEWEARVFPASLGLRNGMNPSAVVISRENSLGEVRFEESPVLQHVEDWDLWFDLVAKGYLFRFTPAITVWYRKHSGGATADSVREMKRFKALAAKNMSQWLPLLANASFETLARIEGVEQRLAAVEKSFLSRLEKWGRRRISRFVRHFRR